MKHFYIDPKTLLGGIVHTDEKQEIVHLSLLAGNTVPEYQINAEISLFVIEGCIELNLKEENKIERVGARELVVLPENTIHSMSAKENSQILVIKVK